MANVLNFLNAVSANVNTTKTANGDKAHSTAGDPVVDFFGLAGAMRATPDKAADLFEKAFNADPLAAVRTLFYLRDVRGGQGERDVFRTSYRRLIVLSPVKAVRYLAHVSTYGRWDDLLALTGVYSAVDEVIFDQIRTQWDKDVDSLNEGGPVSLLAKWLPSDKTGSKDAYRNALAMQVREALGLDQRDYRQSLTALRERIGLLEQNMSTGNYAELDYSKVPGQALRRHVKAFYRNDQAHYEDYLSKVEKGEAKIKTGTVYPHELVDMKSVVGYHYGGTSTVDHRTAQAQWDNLPDWTRGNDALVLADVSGSMYGVPITVSVALAQYFAERNKGAYNGYFMTFSSEPSLVQIDQSKPLQERFRQVATSTSWCGSTDLRKAFKEILRAGQQVGYVPDTLYIISDMQFNAAVNANESTFETAKRAFQSVGLKMPHVVFWNVNATASQLPATAFDGNVTLVSGMSPTVFGMAVEGLSPRELVDQVINGERYARITL